jgi:hypothetical protein
MLHGCGLILLDAGDVGRKGLASIFTNAHHCLREIYVSEIVLHSYDVINGSFLHYQHQFLCTCFGWC